MHENHLYEYAVIRVLPRVEREEFLNVGVIVFCKKAKYIRMLYHLDIDKLLRLSAAIDVEQLQQNLESFRKISAGEQDGGPIAREDLPSRFRWLTAVRSSVLQTSRPHPGFSPDLDKTSEKLFEELVL